MTNKKNQEKIDFLHQQAAENAIKEAQNRARSVVVGTCFGGTIEVSMRRADGSSTFAIMQPVEAIELIHQLAAGVGCHIHIVPRKDFASWRDWKYTEDELAHYRGQQFLPGVGYAPHSNDMAPHQSKGQVLPPPEVQPGLQPSLMTKGDSNETMAIEKTIRRKRSKRTTVTA